MVMSPNLVYPSQWLVNVGVSDLFRIGFIPGILESSSYTKHSRRNYLPPRLDTQTCGYSLQTQTLNHNYSSPCTLIKFWPAQVHSKTKEKNKRKNMTGRSISKIQKYHSTVWVGVQSNGRCQRRTGSTWYTYKRSETTTYPCFSCNKGKRNVEVPGHHKEGVYGPNKERKVTMYYSHRMGSLILKWKRGK